VKIDRGFVLVGLPLGPLPLAVGYVALRQSGVVISDLMLCLLIVCPTAVMLVAAAVAAVLRRDATRWISMATGVIVGTVGVAAVVTGGFSAIAWMISDQAGLATVGLDRRPSAKYCDVASTIGRDGGGRHVLERGAVAVETASMFEGSVEDSASVTFLFTDVEGSTRRWEADAAAMRAALLAHDEVLRSAIGAHDGFLFSHTGDGVSAPRSPAALMSTRSTTFARDNPEAWTPASS
jgi:hypothetical protein